MTNCVDVKVSNVLPGEIDSLSTLIDALQSPEEYSNDIVADGSRKSYVVTVKNGELRKLKDALRVILRVVNAERVDIEPWDGST